MTGLEHLVSLERQRDILRVLSPCQLVVVALRWDGMSSTEVAEALGISSKTVSMRLCDARQAVLRRYPEMERWVKGRDCRRYASHRGGEG